MLAYVNCFLRVTKYVRGKEKGLQKWFLSGYSTRLWVLLLRILKCDEEFKAT